MGPKQRQGRCLEVIRSPCNPLGNEEAGGHKLRPGVICFSKWAFEWSVALYETLERSVGEMVSLTSRLRRHFSL